MVGTNRLHVREMQLLQFADKITTFPMEAVCQNDFKTKAPLLQFLDKFHWNYLKRGELGNICCSNLDHLQRELIRARERLRHKRDVIRSCSRQCGYSL
jgi:hypothetical protein